MKILLVEDEEVLRELYTQSFLKEGYEVVAVSDGKEAIKALRANEDIDCILSDMKMPFYDGFWLFNQLQRNSKYSGIPFHIISGYLDGSEKVMLKKGVKSIHAKPLILEDVIESISVL